VLRHQYELLVLTLGANLVLGRDLPFSRMQSLLQSLQGQLHTRAVAPDYRGALSAALSDDVRGYLRVDAFCERVHTVLERSAVLQLPHVLVKLTLPAQCAHVEVLPHCVPRRTGDVFTADAGHLYVFLFACRLADADAALARIFDVPVERIADTLVHLAEQSIGDELKALQTANLRARIADYSDLFATSLRDDRSALQARESGEGRMLSETAEQLARVEEALIRARAEVGEGVETWEAGSSSRQSLYNETPVASTPRSVSTSSSPTTAPPRRAEPYAMPVRNGRVGGTGSTARATRKKERE
jgi:Cellulose biosynthesis GIL